MQRILLLSFAAAGALLAGCGTPNPCEDRLDYQQAQETRPITVPEGYDALPPESKLEIPTASTPPDVDTKCLERPPRYFEEEGDGS